MKRHEHPLDSRVASQADSAAALDALTLRNPNASVLECRARSLRLMAQTMHPLVAGSIKRRASELELAAFALRCRTIPAMPVAEQAPIGPALSTPVASTTTTTSMERQAVA